MMRIDRLHYISQQSTGLTHMDAIHQALDSGCKWIQLRVKNEDTGIVMQYALQAKKFCDSYGARLIINDFPHIAKAVEAYGLHLGLHDTPIAQARKIVGEQMIIGGTANTFGHIKLRVQEGADYIGLGPLRFTETKENLSPILGMDGYQAILCKMREEGLSIPIIAIGGITQPDVLPLMQTGVYGIAVSSTITFAEDKIKNVNELLSSLNSEMIFHEGVVAFDTHQ